MEITEVRVHKVEREGSRLKGYASITIDDALVINNIRIIDGNTRVFCAMPNHPVGEGKYEDSVHPKNQEARDLIEKKILDEYNKESDEK